MPGVNRRVSTLRLLHLALGFLVVLGGCVEEKEGLEATPPDAKTRIAWGGSVKGLVCGLSFSKRTYRVGEPIEGTLYLNNISDSDLKIPEPTRLRDWNFEIVGPPLGDYDWKGPSVKWPHVEEGDFIIVSPGTIHEESVTPAAQIEQEVKAGEVNWSSVIPGKYRIKIRMWIHQWADDSWAGRIRTGEVEIRVVQ